LAAMRGSAPIATTDELAQRVPERSVLSARILRDRVVEALVAIGRRSLHAVTQIAAVGRVRRADEAGRLVRRNALLVLGLLRLVSLCRAGRGGLRLVRTGAAARPRGVARACRGRRGRRAASGGRAAALGGCGTQVQRENTGQAKGDGAASVHGDS